MFTPLTLGHKKRAYAEDGTWFENDYSCPSCDTKWTDQWSCTSDDDCPQCGTTVSPFESNEVTPEWLQGYQEILPGLLYTKGREVMMPRLPKNDEEIRALNEALDKLTGKTCTPSPKTA